MFKEAFGRLLEDRLDEKMCIECVEPDFVFNLCPKEDIRNNPKVLYVQPGREIVDISVDWEIHFWEDGGMTANYLSVTLDRNDIEYLYRYLQLVTGEIKQDDPQIINMIQRDVLYQ